MKSFLLASATLGLASANIVFNHVPLTCDPNSDLPVQGMTGCLRGMVCTDNGTCKRDEGALYATSFSRAPRERRMSPSSDVLTRRAPAYSTDGRCGPNNNNLQCDPNGSMGPCCSGYGWCGSDAAHCGDGCVSGCKTTTPVKATEPRPDGRCGSTYGGATCDPKGSFGGCCSKYGYCGNTPGHCLVANGCQNGCDGATPTNPNPPASTTGEPVLGTPSATAPANTGVETKDGSCGSSNGGTVCGNWPQGGCCSMYGCE